MLSFVLNVFIVFAVICSYTVCVQGQIVIIDAGNRKTDVHTWHALSMHTHTHTHTHTVDT